MTELLNTLSESSWLWLSLIGTILIGLNFAILGTTLVEKRLSLIGDTFSHAILPGVVLTVWAWGSTPESLLLGAWGAGALLFLLTFLFSKKGKSYQESAFAFLAVFFVAIGMILSFKTRTSSEILHLLLGHIFAFDEKLLFACIILTVLTWLTYFVVRPIWSLWILDPDFLFPQKPLFHLLRFGGPLLLISNLALALQALGAMMTVGLLIIPSLTAQLFCVRLYSRVSFAGILTFLITLTGFGLSYIWDWPLGPSLVVVAGVIHLVSLFIMAGRRV